MAEYSETHRVVHYETDRNGRLTIPMLINLILLASEDQNEQLQLTDDFITSFGVTWVVIQYDIEIHALPKTNSIVTLKTRSGNCNKFFALREFWVLDKNGATLAYVRSLWVTMDINKRKLAPIPPAVVAPYQAEQMKVMPHIAKPKRVEQAEFEHQYRIRTSDIDANNHVNNTRYFDWMIDTLPLAFLEAHSITHINLKYENEVRYGGEVASCCEVDAVDELRVTTKHEIQKDGQLAARANFTWRSNQ